MKKVLNTILIVVFIASLLFDVIVTNAELWGISGATITVVSSVILAIVQLVQRLQMFTEDQVIDFGEFLGENNMSAKHSADTVTRFNQWKSNQ